MMNHVFALCSIMSLPAAYYPIEFSSRRRPGCAVQRLANVIKRLQLSVFVLDAASSNVRFPAVSLSYMFSDDLEFWLCMMNVVVGFPVQHSLINHLTRRYRQWCRGLKKSGWWQEVAIF